MTRSLASAALALALLTVLPFQLRASEPGTVRVDGRVRLRADIDAPFSADAAIPAPAAQFNDTPPAPGPVTTQPPVYQYSEPAPIYQHEYVPQLQARVRYRLRVRPAQLYYQPVVQYEPVAPVLLGDPCLAGSYGYLGAPRFGGLGLGLGRERIDVRYRYRSGW